MNKLLLVKSFSDLKVYFVSLRNSRYHELYFVSMVHIIERLDASWVSLKGAMTGFVVM